LAGCGKDHQTGEKSYLIQAFEKKIWSRISSFYGRIQHYQYLAKVQTITRFWPKNPELVKAMRHYDYTVNITWVMGHFNAAKKYIESGQGNGEATGGSDWKKYMLPKYQRRIFSLNFGLKKNCKTGVKTYNNDL
jgi:tryptophan 2,3-dioxygenase